jgi:hypothetical protein
MRVFTPAQPLPLFLSGREGTHQERGLLLLLNATILAITAILVGIAMALSLGNPIRVFEDAKASLTDSSTPQLQPVQPSPTIQATADARALPPAAGGAREETDAASATAGRSQRDIGESPSDALFREFQAWATKQDVPTQIERVRPAQDARAQDLQQAAVPPVQEHRKSRPVQNARAEIRRPRHPLARVRQNAPAVVRPAPDVQAQDQ